MLSDVININKGSFVSLRRKNINFSEFNFLLLKNCYCNYNKFNINDSIIQFNTFNIPKNSFIEKAILKLPIKYYKYCNKEDVKILNILVNIENFNEKTVNWICKPKTSFYKSIEFLDEDLEREYILVDITELVRKWIENECSNYGITLELKSENVVLAIYNSSKCFSKILIEYKKKVKEENPSMQVQCTNLKYKIVKKNHPIKFNLINSISSNTISYNSYTGDIIISEKGYYMAQWWISLTGTQCVNEIKIGLKNKISNKIIYATSPVVINSQITGSAIIFANEGDKLQLVNFSEGAIQMDNISIQSSLIMLKT